MIQWSKDWRVRDGKTGPQILGGTAPYKLKISV